MAQSTDFADKMLVHGGGPGAEKIAARWAESKGVHQVICRPDWNTHGRAAPFRRNDQLLKLLPKGLISFPGSGVSDTQAAAAVRLLLFTESVIPSLRVDYEDSRIKQYHKEGRAFIPAHAGNTLSDWFSGTEINGSSPRTRGTQVRERVE